MKRKKQLFQQTSLHTWFEMATGKIETTDVNRFSRKETLSSRTIFSDTQFTYDSDFWEDFNFILPEEELTNALHKIRLKIEETNE